MYSYVSHLVEYVMVTNEHLPALSMQADFEGEVPFDDERALHWGAASTAMLQQAGCVCIRLTRGYWKTVGVTAFLAEGWLVKPDLFQEPYFSFLTNGETVKLGTH